jgi:hypothetical protein
VDDERIDMHDGEFVSLILSPKYYWVKIEELPVKYAFQAKEYAQGLFEGGVTEGEYSYKVIKRNGKFVLFAYDVKAILSALERLGVKMPQVRGVYLAQNEFSDIATPIKISPSYALITKDSKLIKAPLSLAPEQISLSQALGHVELSSCKIKLGKFNRYYEKKGAFIGLVYVLAFLIVIYAGELFYVDRLAKAEEAKKSDIFSSYNLPASQIQLNAMIKRLDTVDTKQRAIRQAVGKVWKYSLREGESLKSFELNNGAITASFTLSSEARGAELRRYLESNKFKIDNFEQSGGDVKVRMRYE